MIVYRNNKKRIDVAQYFAHLHELARAGDLNEDRVADLLIDSALLEAGVADWQNPKLDSNDAVSQAFRTANLILGHVFYHSYARTLEVGRWMDKFEAALQTLQALPLPHTVIEGMPEGYAYYSLYPELYLRATLDFVQSEHPDYVVVIGLRNIGTGLSAVVAATLEEQGVPVRSYTVRPRGHPFNRELRLALDLAEQWRVRQDAWFAVVDEGPGLSGSSFASVAQAISSQGIPDSHIVLFPSWQGDETRFLSISAREQWERHHRYTRTFEDVVLHSGILAGSQSDRELIDLSGGKWRHMVFNSEGEYPAVQPQHEMRKYLLGGNAPTLYKFAGLGRYGQAKQERAELLAGKGFIPRPLGLTHGFLASEFVPGRPVSRSSGRYGLLDAIAQYLAFITRTFPFEEGSSFDTLLEMIHINVGEALGTEWRDKLQGLEAFRTVVSDGQAVALDGRMLPYEWLEVQGVYIKTDALDHHDDHFFPGPQNIAWDLAGTCVEFGLGRDERGYLVGTYHDAVKSDSDVERRMPFYIVAYLAFRLGYSIFAQQSVGDAQEATRFQTLVKRYTDMLEQEIVQTCRV